MNEKNLQYYLGLQYDVIVRKIEDEGDTDYKVFTKELNPDAFYGIGATPEEAIESFNEVKEELFPYYLEKGLAIPEPEPMERDLPSGKLLLRMSRRTHQDLLKLAGVEGRSLNSVIAEILGQHCAGYGILKLAEMKLDGMVDRCEFKISQMYRFHGQLDAHASEAPAGKNTYGMVG